MSRWLIGTGIRAPGTGFVATLPPAIVALGPAGYWRLDEAVGPTALDVSGNARHGTYQAGIRLAEATGPGGTYVNCSQLGAGVVIPDFANVSLPNDITVICLAKELNALIGASPSGFTTVSKSDEWAVSFPSWNLFASEVNTVLGVHRVRETATPLLGTSWVLYVVRFPAAAAFQTASADNTNIVGLTSGPTGTRNGNTTSQLILGNGHGALTTPGPTKGRFLAHVAVYDRLLTTPETDGLYAAKVADGW